MIQTIELKLELKKFDRLANYVNFQVLCEIDFNLFFSNIIAFGNVKQKEYYRGLIDECLSFFESEEEYENCQKLFLLKQKIMVIEKKDLISVMFTPAKTFMHGNGAIGTQTFKLNKVYKDGQEIDFKFKKYDSYYGKRNGLSLIDIYIF